MKGTTNGMMTDMDGNFHLEVTDKKVTLMVSYIGVRFVMEVVPGA